MARNIRKPYVRLITKEDIEENFGYDLENMVTLGKFNSAADAINSWLDEAAESIASVISMNMGNEFLTKLNEFVSKEENMDDDLYVGLYWAQMYEFRFFIDNGRFSATSNFDANKKIHDEQSIKTLYQYGIIRIGVA